MLSVIPFCRALLRLCRDRRGVAALEFSILAVPMLLLFIAGGEMAQAVIYSRNLESLAFTLVNLTSQQTICSFPAVATNSNPNPSAGCTNTFPPPYFISTATLDNIFTASAAVMGAAPLTNTSGNTTTNDLIMTLTAVDVTNTDATVNGTCCSFKVRWSYTNDTTARLRGGAGCGTVTLTPVDATQTPPALTNIANALLPMAPAVAKNRIVSDEAILIADVRYTYQPLIFSSLISFAPTSVSTRYMFPRQAGQIVLYTGAPPIATIKSTTSGSTNIGQICF